MGCKWPKFGSHTKVAPFNGSTDQSVSTFGDAVVKQPKMISLNVVLRPNPSNVVDYSKQNDSHTMINGSIDQSILTPVQNLKPLSPDQSTKYEKIAIQDTMNYSTSTSVNNPMQTFKPISTRETTNERLPEQYPISENNQQQEDDYDDKRLNDETFTAFEESIVEENNYMISDTTNDQIEKKIDNSIQDPTISGNNNLKIITSFYYDWYF